MLVLTREIDQSIVIGKDIVITVLECGGGQVRIGIDAPKSINIVRSELLDRADDFPHLDWFSKNK